MASLLASVALCAVVAQAGQSASPPRNAELDRIRQGLRTAHLTIPPITDGSVRYRVFVEERWLRLNIPWDPSKDTLVPPYVRPSYRAPHYEFLRMVTPEEYRAGVLYPGADVLGPAGGLIRSIKRAANAREAAAVRRRIQEELRQIADASGQTQ